MFDHQRAEFCDQMGRHIRLDAHDQIREARRKRRWQIDARLEDERQGGGDHIFHNRRNIAVEKIDVEDCPRDGMQRQQGQRFIDPCYRADDFAVRIFDRKCDVECDERLVLGDENGLAI